jgi:hypothetical protein
MKPKRQINRRFVIFEASLLVLVLLLSGVSTRLRADSGTCSGQTIDLPFNDVASSAFFCQIAAAFFSGLTNGTTATTYSPTNTVTREQMAAFITRTLDQSLRRGSKRAALGQWWTPRGPNDMASHDVGDSPVNIISDGLNLWVANFSSDNVMRVSSLTGVVTGPWTGTTDPSALLVARSHIFVIGRGGTLYQLNPVTPGAATTVTSGLGTGCDAIAYDGTRLWVASQGGDSINAITPNPLDVDSFTAGFSIPFGLVYDGAHLWVTDGGDNSLKKVDITTGAVVQSIALPNNPGDPRHPCFDGTNLWVPNQNNKLYVVRVKDNSGNPLPNSGPGAAFVLAELSGNGLASPLRAAFDGERVLVMNTGGISLWKAADLTPISSLTTQFQPLGVCSDGLNFWFTENSSPTGRITRF